MGQAAIGYAACFDSALAITAQRMNKVITSSTTSARLAMGRIGEGGYALGILLARVVGERIFGATPEPSLLVLVVILGLAMAVTLLGSAIPLRRASRYEPAPILRGESCSSQYARGSCTAPPL